MHLRYLHKAFPPSEVAITCMSVDKCTLFKDQSYCVCRIDITLVHINLDLEYQHGRSRRSGMNLCYRNSESLRDDRNGREESKEFHIGEQSLVQDARES